MCGHVGVAGDINVNIEKILRSMLIFDSLRGEDSTGVAVVRKTDGNVFLAKHLGDPFQLFDSRAFERALRNSNKVIIGHNRYATQGAVSTRNAHPFDFETLVGAHNGTLTNKYKLVDHGNFTVDSENLYHHIEQKGLKHAIETAEGAWALVWWDKVEESLNFLRNKERPLHFCYTMDYKTLFWASEAWMLSVSISRVGLKHTEIREFDVDTHFAIHINDKAEMLKPVLIKHEKQEAQFEDYHPYYKQQQQYQKSVVEKKETGASPSSEKAPYINAKQVLLETLSLIKDDQGNEFISCFDKKLPNNLIRLYPNKHDNILKFVGEEIYGDISAHVYNSTGSYYKVSPWSVKLAIPELDEVAEKLHATSYGNFVSEEQWRKVHGECAWCSVTIYPTESYRFTTDNQCLCPDCAVDKHVAEYVNLK